MESNQNPNDLQWVLQVLENGIINLQKVSFFLSHPSSGCHQETETSININLSKDENALFSYLLTELSTMKKNSTTPLINMEFHRVQWRVEYLQSLGSLLENNPGIEQIGFQRNYFSLDCLEELSEIGLEKYLISININGIDIRVELGGQLGYYIDILACSTKNLTETLRLIHQLIIPAIQSLCQGVVLIEKIMRPECIRNLTPPRYRKTQFLELHRLKEAILSVPADGMYDYQHTWSSVSDAGKPILKVGFDFARDLLSEDDFREVLHRRYHDLYNLANELQIPQENNPSTIEEVDPKVEPSFSGIAKGVEQVLERLKIIEQEIRDLKQEIQGLRYYEHRLLIELHRKVDHLVNYNVQIEERKVPNMFFFVRTENYSRKLVTNIISGMTALRLHMLCEFRREMHVVEDQMGCEIMHVDNIAMRCLAPYMTKFMKLLTFALKIGAHLATGMGQMIPDLSREVAHLLDSSLMTGAAGAAAAGAFGAMAMGSSRRQHGSRDVQQDQRTAQQWVLDFLRDRECSSGRDIAVSTFHHDSCRSF